MEPVGVAHLRATQGPGGGPDKTIVLATARHDRTRARVTAFFLSRHRDPLPGVAHLARETGVKPVILADHGPLDVSLLWRIRRELDRCRCRILHTHDFKSDVVGWGVARTIPGLQLVATAHGWSRPVDAKHRLYQGLDRWVLRRFPRVLTVSEDTASRLVRAGIRRSRVTVIPNGVDVEQWKPVGKAPRPAGFPSEGSVVGVVGRLSLDKDVETVIDALARLVGSFPGTTLVVVGEGPRRAALEKRAREAGMQERVRFLGYRADMREIYAALDLFVQSSRTEGMPNTILEAMAMGRPVVATAVGGVPEMIRDGQDGLLFPVGDAETLAARLKALLEDAELRRRLGEQARRRVEERFSFAARLRRLEDLYEEMARSERPAR